MARRRRRSESTLTPYLQQAAEYATVRYGPEIQALQTLMRQARQTRRQRVSEARESRDAMLSAIDSALPLMGQIFDQAAQRTQQAREMVDADLARIGPVSGAAAAFQRALQMGRETQDSNLALARSGLATTLQSQALATERGARKAIKDARQDYRDALSQILQQTAGLAQQRGAFMASTARELAGEAAAAEAAAAEKAAERATREAIARLNAQAKLDAAELAANSRVQAAKISAAGSGGSGGVRGGASGRKVLSPEEHGKLQDQINRVRGVVANLRRSGANRQEAAEIILRGRPEKRDAYGNVQRAAVRPTTDSPLVAKAALDLVFDGHISYDAFRDLRRRGYAVRRLGFPVNRDRKLRGKRRQQQGDPLSWLVKALTGRW